MSTSFADLCASSYDCSPSAIPNEAPWSLLDGLIAEGTFTRNEKHFSRDNSVQRCHESFELKPTWCHRILAGTIHLGVLVRVESLVSSTVVLALVFIGRTLKASNALN